MATVFLGLGSNMGDRRANLNRAVELLSGKDGIDIIEVSSFYVTKPVGGPPQEDYINGVVKVETELAPDAMLFEMKEIERYMGRRPAGRDFPRPIDLDILFYDDLVRNEDDLTIPHPRVHKRSFVLKGLSEIAPGKVHPVLNKTIKEIYAGNRENADDK